jgi:hypothetical protein
MNASSVQEISSKVPFGPVIIDGHSYPVDPASSAFTDLLMDCFQRGRNAAAARQNRTEAALRSSVALAGGGYPPAKRRKAKAKPDNAHA